MPEQDLTLLLHDIAKGDLAAIDQLMPLVYDEFRRIARHKMAWEKLDHTLQPTALAHEAYLRLFASSSGNSWENRAHFYTAAAEVMRRILIDDARKRARLKHGGGRTQVELVDLPGYSESVEDVNLLALDDALLKLNAEDPEAHNLVKLRYFGGLTIEESARVLGVSDRTAKRLWSYARAWLRRAIEKD